MKTKQARPTRYRELNEYGELTPIFGEWDRTVCFSDIKKCMQCPGGYLMWKEGDAVYRASLSEEIGNIVHEETAKPVEERMQYTAEIAAKLRNVRPEDRQAVAMQVKNLIKKAVRVSDRESMEAIATEHESLMVWLDPYTNTFWYAKADKLDLQDGDRGRYLNAVEQKSGKYRNRLDESSAFFIGYVAKMTRHFDFGGPVKTVLRYLKDTYGNLLAKPYEICKWIGRNLTPDQQDTLHGIQVTIKHIDQLWHAQSFPLNKGRHCRGCQYRHTCPVNKEEFAEQLRYEAERREREQAASLTPQPAEGQTLAPLPAVLTQLVTITPEADIRVRETA